MKISVVCAIVSLIGFEVIEYLCPIFSTDSICYLLNDLRIIRVKVYKNARTFMNP
jgi:hypothetical protein